MYSRTPLLLFAIALPFTGCTCEWHASTNKSWSTNSGGERVVVVQENPDQIAREREARIAREREWERERERERSRRPVVIGAGGRTGTGAAPHSPALGTPVQPARPAPTPLQPGTSGGGSSAGNIGTPAPSPVAPPPAPVPAPPPAVVEPTPPPPPPPPPPASDTYVAPREIDKPAGGASKAGSAVDNPTNKKKPVQRSGPMKRQQ
jgi:hypothetical protein